MAKIALQAKNNNDYRYMYLTTMVALKTGLSMENIDKKINELASIGQTAN